MFTSAIILIRKTKNHSFWGRANTRNVSFKVLCSGQFTCIINSVDNIPNYPVILTHRRSTTLSSETYPLYLRNPTIITTSVRAVFNWFSKSQNHIIKSRWEHKLFKPTTNSAAGSRWTKSRFIFILHLISWREWCAFSTPFTGRNKANKAILD